MIKELQKKGILVSYENNVLELTRADESATIIGVASGGFEEALATLVRKLADTKYENTKQEGLSQL
jgi:hypothetical protein